ncbi:TetR/AcrR family transcriptional regulator C-terminal domain-containing protein [Pseudonocardia phyllosphaerae]|uniref:TetR/AcrR family transcriptional regulator C-terminal domain-containing protein n=1 Tax=Pseudonocardia phyllosphaerae TaxID=3390502 RepID=UPI00397AA831
MGSGLSKDDIVAAALRVLGVRGIDGVTVRAVAAELGVQAAALYYHVRNKQALLDEMGTTIQRRVVESLAGHTWSGSWLDDLSAYAWALRREYLEHRDGARTFSGTLITDPDVLRAQEPWLRRWLDAGVPAEVAFDGGELVTAFVVGFVIEEQERAQSATQPARYGDAERDRRVGDEAPLVRAAGHARHDDEQRFGRQLSAVLIGLDASARR